MEVWKYSKPIVRGWKRNNIYRRKYEEFTDVEKINSYLQRKKYYQNQKFYIKRLVDSNFDNKTSFLTLTQRMENKSAYDIKLSNYEFDKFIRRLKYYLNKKYPGKKLKYLATWERTKKGVIHYHLILFGFPFIPAKKLEEIWRLGFIKINQIKRIDASVRSEYISKYFSKDLEFRDRKVKAFFKSRNLKKPTEIISFFENKDLKESDIGIPSFKKRYYYYPQQNEKKETIEYFLVNLNERKKR